MFGVRRFPDWTWPLSHSLGSVQAYDAIVAPLNWVDQVRHKPMTALPLTANQHLALAYLKAVAWRIHAES